MPRIYKRIDSLQALRAIACIAVVLAHIGFTIPTRVGTGSWGVSVFLVLSGFTLIYGYYGSNRIRDKSVKGCLIFAYNKIKRLYPLYIALTLALFIQLLVGDESTSVRMALFRLLLNVLLVQEYIPLYDRTLAGAAWYLCVAVLSYFLFPRILDLMERKWTCKKAIGMIVISIFVMVLVGMLGMHLPNHYYEANSNIYPLWDHKLREWLIYYCPIVRIWEVFIGTNLGYLYIHREHRGSARQYLIMEIFAIALLLVAFMLNAITYTSVMQGDAEPWWRKTDIYIIGTMLLIYSLAIERGAISHILVNRMTMYIARISPYVFLIHQVIFTFMDIAIYHLPIISDPEQFIAIYGVALRAIIGVPLSIMLSELWISLMTRCSRSNCHIILPGR